MQKTIRRSLVVGGLMVLLISVVGSWRGLHNAAAQEESSWVNGTIVSVRGNILVIRPSLRPVLKRVVFDGKTEIAYYERATREALKPGRRINLGGRYNAQDGLSVRWIEVMEKPGAFTQENTEGLTITKEGDYANGRGILKSVEPFVWTDRKGNEFKASLTRLNGVWRMIRGDRNVLLIGTRVGVSGKDAPDGVLQARQIYPERAQAPFGTMFGTVLSVQGSKITIRPRFTVDTLHVTLKPECRFMRQVTLPESAIKVGQRVTFWGEQRPRSNPSRLGPGEKGTDLKALALLVGNNRLPSAQGENAPRYLTGQLVSLEPKVQLKLPNGQTIQVLPTAQMPIARLETITSKELRAGKEAMFVLSRRSNGSFETGTIILDASPWVGYGG